MPVAVRDLKALEVFCAVVEAQGFAGAQERLGISQPAISGHIKAIEERFGVAVCSRGRAGFRLTEQGQAIYERTKRFLRDYEDYASDIGDISAPLGGRLRLGVVDASISNPELPMAELIGAAFDTLPGVHIELSVAPIDTLEHELTVGAIEIVFGPTYRFVSRLDYRPIGSELQRLYVAACHPLAARLRNGIDARDLKKIDFVSRSYTNRRDVAHLPGVNVAATVASMEAQAMVILSGRCIGYLPQHYAARWVESGELEAIGNMDLDLVSHFHMVARPEGDRSPAASRFLELAEHLLAGRATNGTE